jgi:short-subunit dehydrogenase
MDIDGATALITGASSGIGAALARAMVKRGATVGIVGRRKDKLDAVLEQCRRRNPACRSWVADLGDLDAAEAIARDAWDGFDGLDIIVNNAAMPKRRPAARLAMSEVEETMRVNFLSPARMTLALLPGMLARGSGVIVNVSSMGGRIGIAHEAAYCASKFALCGWSEGLAIDLDGSGVVVRIIEPGPIDTDIWDRPGEDTAVFVPDLVAPEIVADGIIAAVEGEGFEHYLPDLKSVVTWKESDIDAYIRSGADLRRRSEAGQQG